MIADVLFTYWPIYNPYRNNIRVSAHITLFTILTTLCMAYRHSHLQLQVMFIDLATL